MFEKKVLGIDVGGSGIKGAIVDVKTGKLVTERHRIPTPEGGHPDDVVEVIAEIAKHFNWKKTIGCGFPSVIQNGIAMTAANIDSAWVKKDVAGLVRKATGCNAVAVNDADAAGLAEVRFGIGKNVKGTVLVLTVGTGIGSALFYDGRLFPNTELGHLKFKNDIAEKYASDGVRKSEGLKWKQWAARFNEVLLHIERLFWPELIILGGGLSRKKEKFYEYLKIRTKIETALLQNEAGIIGAAVAANEKP